VALIGRDNISRAMLPLEKSCRAVHQRATPAMSWRSCQRNKSGFVEVNLFYALKDSVVGGIQALFPTLAIADLSCKRDRASKPHLSDKGKQIGQRKQARIEAESRNRM
jgi:hypothetical protein